MRSGRRVHGMIVAHALGVKWPGATGGCYSEYY